MNKLYYVELYDWERDRKTRVFLTSTSTEEAEKKALDNWGARLDKVRLVEFVCVTPDTVGMSV